MEFSSPRPSTTTRSQAFVKNAIDWLTRPGSDIPRVFGGKATSLIGTSPGLGGTRFAQTAWPPILRALGVRPCFGEGLFLSGAGKAYDAERKLIDETIRKLVSDYVTAFAKFVADD